MWSEIVEIYIYIYKKLWDWGAFQHLWSQKMSSWTGKNRAAVDAPEGKKKERKKERKTYLTEEIRFITSPTRWRVIHLTGMAALFWGLIPSLLLSPHWSEMIFFCPDYRLLSHRFTPVVEGSCVGGTWGAAWTSCARARRWLAPSQANPEPQENCWNLSPACVGPIHDI